MNTRSDERTAFERFLDAFFQERNIKWMLAVGVLVLLASSVMLVSMNWQNYGWFWKHAVLLAYTGVVYAAGRICYFRLALRRTGTVLLALTVFLLPLGFVALGWLHDTPSAQQTVTGWWDGALLAVLFAVQMAFSAAAAGQIFNHFFSTPPRTFTAAYLMLSAAGGWAHHMPTAWALPAVLTLWAVFTVGTIKINRHVFWLGEKHRTPKIFEFFPIALLGTQFLALFGMFFAVPLLDWFEAFDPCGYSWFGLGCLLVAYPILSTADTVARVFEQRTGGLVRPLPWSVVTPFGIGLMLCVLGLGLAGSALLEGQSHPYALVPTAALAALTMLIVARRTRSVAFVWAMLLTATLAYQFSPAFFQDLARQVVQSAAKAVHEPKKLPYAFYGLTYLPLVLTLLVSAKVLLKRGTEWFARPIQQYAIGLSLLLLATSLGHIKAMLPVALAMTGVFALATVLFRQRLLAWPALVSFGLAAGGLSAFCEQVLMWPEWKHCELTCLGSAALLLLAGGTFIDRWLQRLNPQRECPAHCRWVSLLLTIACVWGWIWQWIGVSWGVPHPGWPTGGLLAVAFLAHGWRWRWAPLSVAALGFAQLYGIGLALHQGVDGTDVFNLVAVQLALQWLAGYVLQKRPTWRLSQAYGTANQWVCVGGLGTIAAVATGFSVMTLAGLDALDLWPGQLLAVVWMFDTARRYRVDAGGWFGCLCGMLLVGAAAKYAFTWNDLKGLPLVWASTAVALIPVWQWLRRRVEGLTEPNQRGAWLAVTLPIGGTVVSVLWTVAVGSILSFEPLVMIAGAVAFAGLLLTAAIDRKPLFRVLALVPANWQLLGWLVWLLARDVSSVFDFEQSDLMSVSLPLSLAAAASLWAWTLGTRNQRVDVADVALFQRVSLGLMAGLMLVVSLAHDALLPHQILLAAAVFALLALHEFFTACRRQSEESVWTAQAILAVGVAYFAWFRVIHFGRGISMFVVFAAGVLFWIVSQVVRRWPAGAIMARPLKQTALVLPAVTVMIALYRHFAGPGHLFPGHNSLAVLLAGGFYFWRGIEQQHRGYLVAAGAALNAALAILWQDLSLTDPQFYLVPLGVSVLVLVQMFRQEIPRDWHDPLRYLGAALILVTPSFQIVDGSVPHMVYLLVGSISIVLVSMGLRVRALLYAGSGFLLADLVAMITNASRHNMNVLWITGLGVGAAVVVVAAICENHREDLLQRMRQLAARLEAWE